MNPRFCPTRHTAKINGIWVRGGESQVEIVTTVNGRTNVKLRCTNCRWLTGALPLDVAFEWLDPFGPHVFRSNEGDVECCVTTCSSNYVEMHHFSPRNTFGEGADDWPVLPLCREHHVEWHTRMDGYEWHRKRAA